MVGGLPPPRLFTADVASFPSAPVIDDTGSAWPTAVEVAVTADPTLETSLPTTSSTGASMPLPLLVGAPGEVPLPGVGAAGAPPLGTSGAPAPATDAGGGVVVNEVK